MEYPDLGAHCSIGNCNTLDFLPHPCPLCKKTFCGPHRFPASHDCQSADLNNRVIVDCKVCGNRVFNIPGMGMADTLKRHADSKCQLYLYNPPNKATQRPCGVDGCKDGDPLVGLVKCEACLGLFCLKHRYTSAHSCASKTLAQQEKQDRKVTAQQKIEQHLGKRLPTAEKSKQATVKVKKVNPRLELMKMKGKAKGDTSIPLESRMYFSVHFPENSGREPCPLYFDKSHTIGRMLDQIAKIGNITNNNHLLSPKDPKRLQIALLPDKTIIDTEHRIVDILENTSQIVIDMNMNLT